MVIISGDLRHSDPELPLHSKEKVSFEFDLTLKKVNQDQNETSPNETIKLCLLSPTDRFKDIESQLTPTFLEQPVDGLNHSPFDIKVELENGTLKYSYFKFIR